MRIAIFLLTALLCQAQDKGPEAARRVIDDAVKALGGDAFLNMKDRVEEGRSYSFYNEKLSGMSRAKMYIRYLTRPEPMQPEFYGIRERRAFGKKEDVYIVYNETGGFEITYRGAKPLPAETVSQYKESLMHNVLYTLRMRLGEPGLTFDWAGTDVNENMPCNVVDIVDGANRVTKVWFHQSTKLPVRQMWEHRDPKTKYRQDEITIFDKYRDIGGGIMWPYVVRRERNGERNYEMYADSIVVNQSLGDELFTIQGDIQVREEKSSNVKPGRK